MPRFASLPAAIAALLVAVTFASCGDGPTEPSGGRAIRGGETVAGRVDGGSRSGVTLRYDAPSMEAFELFFRADGDSIGLYRIHRGLNRVDTMTVVAPGARDTTTRLVRFPVDITGNTFTWLIAARPGSAGGNYRLTIRPRIILPESRVTAVQLGEVANERLDTPIDVDRYRLTLTQPTDVVLLLQYADQASDDVDLRAFIQPLADSTYARNGEPQAVAARVDSTFESSITGRTTLAAGSWNVFVARYNMFRANEETPRYHLEVRAVNPAPEDRNANIAPGDTIASSIDYYGDYDTWELHGEPGESLVAFVEAAAGTPHVMLRTAGATTSGPGTVIATPTTPLLRNATGSLVVPESGIIRLVVEGAPQAVYGRSRGAYRLLALRSDTSVTTLALGSAASGALSAPGEVDLYRLTLATPSTINVALERPSVTGSDAFTASLRRGTIEVASVSLPNSAHMYPLRGGSGRVALAAGTYALRVGSSGTGGAYIGPYTVRVSPIDSLPESAAATIVPGDSVRGEALEVAGDVDRFTFSVGGPDTVAVRVVPANPVMQPAVRVFDSNGAAVGMTAFRASEALETGRLALPRAGTYTIRVDTWSAGADLADAGAYRLELYRMSIAPERLGATLSLGQTLADERIDYVGDVDTYLLSAPAGTEVVFPFRGASGVSFVVRVFDASSGTPLVSQVSGGYDQATRRIAVPASGTLRVVVEEDSVPCVTMPCGNARHASGAYTLSAHRIDRAPEGRDVGFAIGDTISERIDPIGDVDEYHFVGIAGDRLVLQFATPQGTSCSEGQVASIHHPSGGPALASIGSNNPGPLESHQAVVTLSETSTYMLRAEGVDARCGTGIYLVRIARQP